MLPDGTKVWLNAASSIRYPAAFTGNERMVEVKGEAYFEVMHNDKMPFKVKAGGEIVQDIGTRFNINAYDDEPSMKTTLVEGSVKIMWKLQQPITLAPGQQIEADKSGQITLNRDADIEEAIAWKNGKFEFDNTDLATILRQVSRWYDVDITYKDDLGTTKFGGGISRNLNLSAILHLLESTGAHFTLDKRVIIVSY
jgi:ferric-dicitrate binding protein FerR (iron transport regulator)